MFHKYLKWCTTWKIHSLWVSNRQKRNKIELVFLKNCTRLPMSQAYREFATSARPSTETEIFLNTHPYQLNMCCSCCLFYSVFFSLYELTLCSGKSFSIEWFSLIELKTNTFFRVSPFTFADNKPRVYKTIARWLQKKKRCINDKTSNEKKVIAWCWKTSTVSWSKVTRTSKSNKTT